MSFCFCFKMISTVQLNAVSKMSLIRDTARSHCNSVGSHHFRFMNCVFNIWPFRRTIPSRITKQRPFCFRKKLESARHTVQYWTVWLSVVPNSQHLSKFVFLWISKQQQQKWSFHLRHCKPKKYCSWLKYGFI